MGKFGFEPTDGDQGHALEDYATGKAYLGEHSETFSFWAKRWSTVDYVRHWQEAAAALLAGDERVLFCTDYAPLACSRFVGWPDEEGFIFEEWVVTHKDVTRDGLRLRYVGTHGKASADASHFRVSKADVEAFVR